MQGREALEDGKSKILSALKAGRGFIPLTDSSDREEIMQLLGISKNLFKRSAGSLLKDGLITLDPDGIRLKRG